MHDNLGIDNMSTACNCICCMINIGIDVIARLHVSPYCTVLCVYICMSHVQTATLLKILVLVYSYRSGHTYSDIKKLGTSKKISSIRVLIEWQHFNLYHLKYIIIMFCQIIQLKRVSYLLGSLLMLFTMYLHIKNS